MHRFTAFMQMALVDDLAQAAHNIRFNIIAHGEIRLVPVTQYAESNKIITLPVHLALCIVTALVAEGFCIDFLSGLADFFLYIEFNRQAVTIPAGHIGCIVTVQGAAFDNDVF